MSSRKLSLLDATSIVIGIVIGSGIFLVPSNIAAAVGTPSSLLVVWGLAGMLSLFGALSYAELGAVFPQAGGQYAYLREAYGAPSAFLFGWSLFWVAQSGSIAAVAVGFATYLAHFLPLGGAALALQWPFSLTVSWVQVAAALLIALLTLFNYLGLQYGAFIQNLFTALKTIACLSIVVICLAGGSRPVTAMISGGVAPANAWSYAAAFGVAMVAALWAFDGWNNVTFVAAETERPERNVPRALILGTAVIIALYVLMNLAYMRVLDIGQIASSERVAADAVAQVLGASGSSIIALFIIVSTFGCVNGMILAAARVYRAQAEDGLFPKAMATLHPRFSTPSFALVTQGIWSAVLAISGRYDQLFTFAIFALWIFYGMSVFAVFVFRRRGLSSSGYRVWGYPLVPAIFVALCLGLLINTLIETPLESLTGAGLILLGLPAYIYYRRRSQSSLSAKP